MKNLTIFQILLFTLCAALTACSRAENHLPLSAQSSESTSPTPNIEVRVSPTPNSPIRSIDFENFTLPARPIYPDGQRNFTLRDGRYEGRLLDGAIETYRVGLVETIYGDVTGDGNEEAMLVLTMNNRGTAIPYYVYIYTLERGRPKQLWSFEDGDRAEGGLRRLYAENGNLVVELYGRNKYVGGDYYSENEGGACCPSHYTRSRYEWRNNHFRRAGSLEVFPVTSGRAGGYLLAGETE